MSEYCQQCGMRTKGGVYACGHSPADPPGSEMLRAYDVHKLRCMECGDDFLPTAEAIAPHADHPRSVKLFCTLIGKPESEGFWMDFMFFASDYKVEKPN